MRVWFALITALSLSACTGSDWVLVDDFEQPDAVSDWARLDIDNQTDPFIPDPQISEIKIADGNRFMLRKPAADGVIGNRKAIGRRDLPHAIEVGDVATLYLRFNVERFPNNHSFGLTNQTASAIEALGYDAFEPMFRITDKAESDGTKNDGTLMILTGKKRYSNIFNPATGQSAKPLEPGLWYEMWGVINNATLEDGGQTYDLYLRGGEFNDVTQVYTDARFRKGRSKPLTGFMAISNTGPKRGPYGNGGVRYDDIYLAQGLELTTPRVSPKSM